jgi:hypothetical protein
MKVLVVFLVLFLGCARAPEEVPFSKADVSAHAELAQWLKLWTPPLSPLTASSFRLIRESDSIGELLDDSSPYGNAGFPKWLYKWLQYSPDSAWAVDIWLWSVDSSGVYQGEVDSHCTLLDRARGRFYLLSFCGTPCGFHTAIWISGSSFLLAGWEECEGDTLGCIQPVLTRFDLQEKRKRTFAGPPIGQKDVAAIEAAVREQQLVWFPWLRFGGFN